IIFILNCCDGWRTSRKALTRIRKSRLCSSKGFACLLDAPAMLRKWSVVLVLKDLVGKFCI
ncbi:hypothetical protein CIB84_010947, partial [Bambusicola thoracicus]